MWLLYYVKQNIAGEGIIPTAHEKIVVLKGLECNLKLLNRAIDQLSESAEEQNKDKIIVKLKKIVPDDL